MAASIGYNDGGTWRTITQPSYNDGGTWRTLSEVHYNDSGTWRKVFPGVGVPQLSDYTLDGTAGNPASFTLESDGELITFDDGGTVSQPAQWLSIRPDSATASLYSARRTQVSGSLGVTFTNCPNGVWGAMTINRGVTVAETGVIRSNISTWDIALTADLGTILATCTVTMSSSP